MCRGLSPFPPFSPLFPYFPCRCRAVAGAEDFAVAAEDVAEGAVLPEPLACKATAAAEAAAFLEDSMLEEGGRSSEEGGSGAAFPFSLRCRRCRCPLGFAFSPSTTSLEGAKHLRLFYHAMAVQHQPLSGKTLFSRVARRLHAISDTHTIHSFMLFPSDAASPEASASARFLQLRLLNWDAVVRSNMGGAVKDELSAAAPLGWSQAEAAAIRIEYRVTRERGIPQRSAALFLLQEDIEEVR